MWFRSMFNSLKSPFAGTPARSTRPRAPRRRPAVPLQPESLEDRTVPTAVCVEILSSLHKSSFTVHMLPTGHGLLVNPTGLLADDDRSPGLAPDLVPTLKAWIVQVISA